MSEHWGVLGYNELDEMVAQLEAENERLRDLLRPLAERFVAGKAAHFCRSGPCDNDEAWIDETDCDKNYVSGRHMRACCAALGIEVEK